jgi:hypothetical protein
MDGKLFPTWRSIRKEYWDTADDTSSTQGAPRDAGHDDKKCISIFGFLLVSLRMKHRVRDAHGKDVHGREGRFYLLSTVVQFELLIKAN